MLHCVRWFFVHMLQCARCSPGYSCDDHNKADDMDGSYTCGHALLLFTISSGLHRFSVHMLQCARCSSGYSCDDRNKADDMDGIHTCGHALVLDFDLRREEDRLVKGGVYASISRICSSTLRYRTVVSLTCFLVLLIGSSCF